MDFRTLAAVAALLCASPSILAHEPAGAPKTWCESAADRAAHDYGPPGAGLVTALWLDGNVDDCDGDGVPLDADGHSEFAFGGAWLLAVTGDGVTHGTLLCYGEVADHPLHGPITVTDALVGPNVPFHVAVDRTPEPQPPDFEDCGDFEADDPHFCPGSPCHVPWEPDADGAYIVYVGDHGTPGVGVAGHVSTP